MTITPTITHACFPTTRPTGPEGGREGVSQRTGVYRVRIMTGAAARDGDVVDPLGMSVEEYLRNPVVLWNHDWQGRTPAAGLPVGRTVSLERAADGIEAGFEFLPDDSFAQRVRNAWDRGFLNAASIGWRTLESEPLPGGRGRRHTRTVLLEWSLVPVPADPGASREVWVAGLRSLGYGDLVEGREDGSAPMEELPDLRPFIEAARELSRAFEDRRGL